MKTSKGSSKGLVNNIKSSKLQYSMEIVVN